MIGWIKQGQHGQLHLAGFDLLAEILGRPPDHQSGQKHAHDQVDEQVDHAHPLAAENAVEPHAGQGRDAGQRIQAVVHAVDRAAGDGGRDGRIGRAGRGAETQLFPFEVAQLLVDGQAGNRRDVDGLWSDTGRRRRARRFDTAYRPRRSSARCAVKRGLGCSVSQ